MSKKKRQVNFNKNEVSENKVQLDVMGLRFRLLLSL